MTNQYKAIVATQLDAGHDNNGIPCRLYIVSGIHENAAYGMDRLAIIDVGYNGRSVLLERFPGVVMLETVNIGMKEYKRWVKVMKSEQAIADLEAMENYEEERTNQ